MRKFSNIALEAAKRLQKGRPAIAGVSWHEGQIKDCNLIKDHERASHYAAIALSGGKVEPLLQRVLAPSITSPSDIPLAFAGRNIVPDLQEGLLNKVVVPRDAARIIAEGGIEASHYPKLVSVVVSDPLKGLVLDPEAGFPSGQSIYDITPIAPIISQNARIALQGRDISDDLERELIDNLTFLDTKVAAAHVSFDNKLYLAEHAVTVMLSECKQGGRDSHAIGGWCKAFIKETEFTFDNMEQAFAEQGQSEIWNQISDQVQRGLTASQMSVQW